MPEQTTPDAPESAALPPEPWEIDDPLPWMEFINVRDGRGELIVTGTTRAVAAILIAGPRTARRLAHLESAAREARDLLLGYGFGSLADDARKKIDKALEDER